MENIWAIKPRLYILEFIYRGKVLEKVKYVNENLLECKVDKFGQFNLSSMFLQSMNARKLVDMVRNELIELSNCEVCEDKLLRVLEGYQVTETTYTGLRRDTKNKNLKQVLFKSNINGRKALFVCDSKGYLDVIDYTDSINPMLRAVQVVNFICYSDDGKVVVKRKKGSLRVANISKSDLLKVTSTLLGEIYLNRCGKFIMIDECNGFISKEFNHIPYEFLVDSTMLLDESNAITLESLRLDSNINLENKCKHIDMHTSYYVKYFGKLRQYNGCGILDISELSNVKHKKVVQEATRNRGYKHLKELWEAFKLPPVFKGVVKLGSPQAKILNVNANISIFYIPIQNQVLNSYKSIPIKYISCIYFHKARGFKVSEIKYIKVVNFEDGNLNSLKIVGMYLGEYTNGRFSILYDLLDSKTGKILKTWEE